MNAYKSFDLTNATKAALGFFLLRINFNEAASTFILISGFVLLDLISLPKVSGVTPRSKASSITSIYLLSNLSASMIQV